MTARPLLAAALALLGACAPRAPAPGGAPAALDRVERCRYDVEVERAAPLRLDVIASCTGRGVSGLAAPSAAIADWAVAVHGETGALRRRGKAFELDRPRGSASFRYRLDLAAVAEREASFDVALKSGRSLIAPASTFLFHPLPLDVGIEVELHVRTPPGLEFVTGLEPNGDGYRLEAHEIPVATYAVFAPAARRSLRVGPDRAAIELAILDGELALSPDELAAWVARSAEAVAAFYTQFPARRALVAVVPRPRRHNVVFGKLLPESAPGIVLLVGARARAAELDADWVLVHELFHIGVPSFYREGKWFDEGLATYFEPIIRARAGLYDELELWREFARQMPRGVPALARDGLENVRGYTGMYWGGALYCLLADVTARKRTAGRLGLEHGIRRVREQGGHASDVWALDRALAAADSVYPEPILGPLAARYEHGPGPFDLAAIFGELGVRLGEADVVLDGDPRKAWLRRAIVYGRP